MTMVPGRPDEEQQVDGLTQELERRRARRYRRRWFRRWRRRRLLVHLMAVEFDLTYPRSDDLRELHQEEMRRFEARLERNAERLFK